MLQTRRFPPADDRSSIASEQAPSAQRVGADLRLAREHLGWTLPAIAAHLRIRLPYLEAIEDGRIADLPGNAYAVGFLRTYAKALGLDPEEIARRFRAEAADVNRKTELTFPAPVPERGVPAGAIVLLGLVIAVIGYVGWYRMTSDRPSPEPPRPVPERLAPLAGTVAVPGPASSAPATATATQAPAVPPPPMVAAVPAPAPPASPPPAAPPPATVASGPAPAGDGAHIVLRATADAWVQVREKQGPVVLNRVMRSGETWSVPARPNLLLTTGNAGGTELLVDGVASPALGGDGAVRRDLPLDPDMIKLGKLAAVQPAAGSPATGQAATRPAQKQP